jgi:hypothetical protein
MEASLARRRKRASLSTEQDVEEIYVRTKPILDPLTEPDAQLGRVLGKAGR